MSRYNQPPTAAEQQDMCPPERPSLECPCCGDVGAYGDDQGLFHDGQILRCGCDGGVSMCSEEEPYINSDCVCGDAGLLRVEWMRLRNENERLRAGSLAQEVEALRAEVKRLKDDDSRHRLWRSGPHLGAVRRWMQWHCRNGSAVTWGSTDRLEHEFTVLDLEEIAERIRETLTPEADDE